jgi:hypothetical protein
MTCACARSASSSRRGRRGFGFAGAESGLEGAESSARANEVCPPEVMSVIRLLQGLRQRLMQTKVALREAQAKKDAEAASCAAMAERLQAGACDTHSH